MCPSENVGVCPSSTIVISALCGTYLGIDLNVILSGQGARQRRRLRQVLWTG